MESSKSTETQVWKPAYCQRDNPHAIKLFVRLSPTGHFNAETKERILRELREEELRLVSDRIDDGCKRQKILSPSDFMVKEVAKESIGNYYGIGLSTLKLWESKTKTGSPLTPKKRSGRPPVVDSPVKYRILQIRNEDNGKTASAVAAKLAREKVLCKDGTVYKTTYRGKTRYSPSKKTILRLLSTGTTLSVKPRP